MLEEIGDEVPVMLFGGESLSTAHKFDAIRSICLRKNRVCGVRAESLVDVVLGVLAGVAFFETDMPLELA